MHTSRISTTTTITATLPTTQQHSIKGGNKIVKHSNSTLNQYWRSQLSVIYENKQQQNHNPNLIFINMISSLPTCDFPNNNTETRLESEGNKTVQAAINRIRNSAKQTQKNTHIRNAISINLHKIKFVNIQISYLIVSVCNTVNNRLYLCHPFCIRTRIKQQSRDTQSTRNIVGHADTHTFTPCSDDVCLSLSPCDYFHCVYCFDFVQISDLFILISFQY